ncbi:hypothetical protein [Streptomyces sp. NBC_01465]|uniref:hypothetical protein n=1 Tax=Streptomyces sp. NBC_01465 TaxID=2903878 RepID=UPI002E35AD5D|nr:hypothetical protein [Streptomyces sp. NBC_01465]
MIPLAVPARPGYLRAVRASAWYDLVVTAGFATPWTYALVHDALSSLGRASGLGEMPQLDTMQTLFANLMGSVVVVWALLRITKPQPVHGLFDGIARILFSAWLAYALVDGAPHLLWGFLGVEVAFGIVQLVPLWRNDATRNSSRSAGPVQQPSLSSGPTDG